MSRFFRNGRSRQRYRWSLPVVATAMVLAAVGSAVALDAPGAEPGVERESNRRFVAECMTSSRPACLDLLRSTVYRVVRAHGLEHEWPTVRHLVTCESRWTTRAVGEAGELGLWQIHPVHAWRWKGRDWRNPVDNTEVAMEIYGDVGSWEPWSCSRLPAGSTLPLAGVQ